MRLVSGCGIETGHAASGRPWLRSQHDRCASRVREHFHAAGRSRVQHNMMPSVTSANEPELRTTASDV
jgi:hypothetical protein